MSPLICTPFLQSLVPTITSDRHTVLSTIGASIATPNRGAVASSIGVSTVSISLDTIATSIGAFIVACRTTVISSTATSIVSHGGSTIVYFTGTSIVPKKRVAPSTGASIIAHRRRTVVAAVIICVRDVSDESRVAVHAVGDVLSAAIWQQSSIRALRLVPQAVLPSGNVHTGVRVLDTVLKYVVRNGKVIASVDISVASRVGSETTLPCRSA